MYRRGMIGAALASIGGVVMLARSGAAQQPAAAHRLALHIDQNDPAVMTMALGNAANAAAYFAQRGETVAVELVAYGPGLHMLRADTSPVKARLADVHKTMPQMVFSGCNNTLRAMQKTEDKEIALVSEARIVPAGIVRLMELQEAGWSYVRP
jgi:intracellular sulfur oxidation DsrE/DsrF family protein